MRPAATHFAADYRAARTAFLRAAQDGGVETGSHRLDIGKCPAGRSLYTDVAHIGPTDAPALLVLISATHGVEGFCGSGCQVAFLRDLPVRRFPPTLAVVLIHALNPYGFAWLRRVTEGNVDLNRNFVDHLAPYPENPDYDALAMEIAPAETTDAHMAAANAALRAYRQDHGAMALQAAVTRGQYRHPKGLYFGGHEPSWSNRTLYRILDRFVGPAQRIAAIDFHTGLGPYGYGELITEQPEDHPAYERARKWWGESVKSTVSGASVSARLTGTIDNAVLARFPEREVTATALEFGTSPPAEVFRALRLDNWLHAYDDPQGPRAAEIKAEIRRVFYPDTDDWKKLVLARAREVIDRAITGLTADTA